jgi:hypothetical protein
MLQEALYINGRVISLEPAFGHLFLHKNCSRSPSCLLGGRGDITWPPGDTLKRSIIFPGGILTPKGTVKVFHCSIPGSVGHHEDSTHFGCFGNFLASLMNTPKFVPGPAGSGGRGCAELSCDHQPTSDQHGGAGDCPPPAGHVPCSNADGAMKPGDRLRRPHSDPEPSLA